MSSKNARRKKLKRIYAAANRSPSTYDAIGDRLLRDWQGEANYRAQHLGAPAAWALADNRLNRILAMRLDPSGDLYSHLRRVCAEAVAKAYGRHLISGSRPSADRSRY